MDLTNEDVADVLALLDSLPYDSLDLETPRFRLTLRRAPGGTGWTEESQVLTEPAVLAPSPDAAPASASAGSAAPASRRRYRPPRRRRPPSPGRTTRPATGLPR